MIDKHHIIHNRLEWSLREDALWIREQPSLILPVERSFHNDIHRYTEPIPLLGYHALASVRKNYTPGEDVIESIDNLCDAVDIANSGKRVKPIEKELGNLVIKSLLRQSRFIEGSL